MFGFNTQQRRSPLLDMLAGSQPPQAQGTPQMMPMMMPPQAQGSPQGGPFGPAVSPAPAALPGLPPGIANHANQRAVTNFGNRTFPSQAQGTPNYGAGRL